MDKRKILGTILGTLLFISCILIMSYAWYTWRSADTNVDLTIEDISDPDVVTTIEKEITSSQLGPVLDYLNSEYYTDANKGLYLSYVDFNIASEAEVTYYMNAKLDISSIGESLKVDSFKYSLVKESTAGTDIYDDVICEGNFSSFDVGTNVACRNIEVPSMATTNYRFIVYIDGHVYNDEEMMSDSLNAILQISVAKTANLDASGANAPNLVDGMIPVYYDESSKLWRKADSNNLNSNYQWYDYDNKMWANAVLVSSTNRNTYKSAVAGTAVTMSDILAFYVWIPRYKYRVWNITRQAGDETTYGYSAYSEGIDIVFENSKKSTGNVTCSYNTATVESEDNLSDVCIYNGSTTITLDSTNYSDAWYTHPAFKFGSKNITGFWMGKFETGGTASAPVVKPDVQSLINQNVSTQFTTSKVFQTYGLSSDLDAHMVTNLEWGAVVYFMYSDYGLCDSSGCRDAYFNNSSNRYTGRSYGNFAASSVSTTSGTYSYDGYVMTDDTTKSSDMNISKIASITGNIYGVYDMNGGSYEYVMGNMVDSSNNFYPSSSGTSWNGSSTLDSKYYNSYSYGENYYNQIAFNRSRLGDATGESTASISSSTAAWKPGIGITGANSYFVYGSNSWFSRGGYFDYSNASSFNFYSDYGGSGSSYSFRSSLS